MPLKRIRSLTYRWLHVLQPDIIHNMFSSVSGSGTTSLCEAIEMHPIFPSSVEMEAAGSGQGHEWLEIGTWIRIFLQFEKTFPKKLILNVLSLSTYFEKIYVSGRKSQPRLVRPVWRDDLGPVRHGGVAVRPLQLHGPPQVPRRREARLLRLRSYRRRGQLRPAGRVAP